MKLKSLKIEVDRWGEHKGKYIGEAVFGGKSGSVAIVMNPEVTESFLALAGELLMAHIEVAGRQLQGDIEDAVGKALETNRTAIEIANAFKGQAKLLEGGA